MKKKFISLLLTAGLAASLFAGCGGSSEDAGSKPAATGTEQGDTNDDANAGDDAATPDDAEEEDDEPAEIVVGLMCFAPIDQGVQDRIEAKVNEMMSEMINVTADFQWYDATTYMTQIPMMISSGEQLDVIMYTPIPAAGYSAFMSQGQLMDVSEYLKYAPDAQKELGEAGLAATSRNGGVYGFGATFANYGGQAICFRKDVLEEIGKLDDFNNMKSWDEFEVILQAAVDAGYTGLVNCDAEGSTIAPQPYLAPDNDFATAKWVDIIGDGNQMVFADQETGKVVSFFGSEEYKQCMLRVADYYQKGLVYKDASTAADYADTQIKNGVGVCMSKTLEFGWEDSLPASCGYPMAVKFVDGAMNLRGTGSYTKFGYAVPVTAQEPKAAVKFINLLYQNSDLHDTLAWGEEGVDWVKANGTANYIEGNETPEYHQMDFLYAGIMTVTPWGSDPDLRTKQIESNATVEPSRFIGFAIDNTAVANEVTACQNVNNQYKPIIGSGAYGADTAAKYDEWMAALEAAGMQKIIDEYQRQLDEWLAANE